MLVVDSNIGLVVIVVKLLINDKQTLSYNVKNNVTVNRYTYGYKTVYSNFVTRWHNLLGVRMFRDSDWIDAASEY
jgi:hypothetical protein